MMKKQWSWLKALRLVPSLVIVCCAIAVLILYAAGNFSACLTVTYVLCGLYAVQILGIVIGLAARKLRLREHKELWVSVFVQMFITLAVYLFVILHFLYKFADVLSHF